MRIFVLLVGLMTGFPLGSRAQTPPPLLARPPEQQPSHLVTAQLPDDSKIVLSKPKPQYPAEALRRRITGKGVYYLHVSYDTGEVTSVDIVSSTGQRILDDAAVAALKQWKFGSHSLIGCKLPITFSMPKKT